MNHHLVRKVLFSLHIFIWQPTPVHSVRLWWQVLSTTVLIAKGSRYAPCPVAWTSCPILHSHVLSVLLHSHILRFLCNCFSRADLSLFFLHYFWTRILCSIRTHGKAAHFLNCFRTDQYVLFLIHLAGCVLVFINTGLSCVFSWSVVFQLLALNSILFEVNQSLGQNSCFFSWEL